MRIDLLQRVQSGDISLTPTSALPSFGGNPFASLASLIQPSPSFNTSEVPNPNNNTTPLFNVFPQGSVPIPAPTQVPLPFPSPMEERIGEPLGGISNKTESSHAPPSEQILTAFQSSHFTFGKIPETPPPTEYL